MEERKGFFTSLGEFLDQISRRFIRGVNGQESPSRFYKLLSWLTPNGGTILIALLLILTQQVWADQSNIAASNPGPSANTVNYQGRLADSGGVPQTGAFSMTFSLWDAAIGGNVIWGPEAHPSVPVSNGLFSVGLGAQTSGGIPTNVWDGDRYLQITIGNETLSPRELIRSVPIAGMALTVPDGAISQNQAPFAPKLYYQPDGGSIVQVNQPIIYSGWFHGSSSGQQTFDLSSIFSEIDAVIVTKTRTVGGVDTPVTFKVTDASGLNKPTPSQIKISAYDMSGNAASWIQAYVIVIGQ